jgi:hypothetical protein
MCWAKSFNISSNIAAMLVMLPFTDAKHSFFLPSGYLIFFHLYQVMFLSRVHPDDEVFQSNLKLHMIGRFC